METRRLFTLFGIMIAIVVVLALLLSRCGRADDSADTPEATATPSSSAVEVVTPEAEATATPVPSVSPTANVTPAPAATTAATTAPTATPSPTPSPTPTPTAAPTPTPIVGTLTAQGSFSSDTGTSLNMAVNWSAVDNGDGTTTISLSGTVTSYSLSVMANSVSISFAGYSASTTAQSISVESSTYTISNLFSTSLTVPSGTAGDMTVTWNYNGTYSDVTLDTITATDYVYTS